VVARFFLEVGPRDGFVHLSASDARHLVTVLRARPGDRFVALFGGTAYTCALEPDGGGRVLAEEPARGEPPVAITLFQGLTKGDKMETVIQHGTEIGISRFVPVVTARSVVRLEERKAAERVARWQRIAREAAEQCRRGAVPPVDRVIGWPQAAARAGELDLALVPWEEGGVPLAEALLTAGKVGRIALYIGPEGGLTGGEVAAAAGAGAKAVTLGPRILRTETAALAAAAAILFAVGDLGVNGR
jgi:16S rRNA (uracil1498-N3)-methyltransferase